MNQGKGQQMLFQTVNIEDCRTGTKQIISNIDSCIEISDFMSSTLGPFGLDKLFYGENLIITNDGATILESMKFSHPIAKILENATKTQDNANGDGTTSVILLGCEILRNLKKLILDKFEISEIIESLNEIKMFCLESINDFCVEFNEDVLKQLGKTCMSSKNIRNYRGFFSNLIYDSMIRDFESNSKAFNLDYIFQPGSSLEDSFFINGVVFEKAFTYAGYEQQPKCLKEPKIAFLDIELEWRNERENVELKIENVEDYEDFVDIEYKILFDKLHLLIKSGANIVLSSMPIGDLATQFFAKYGIFCAGRVAKLNNIATILGGSVCSTVNYLSLGSADLFEERQIGNKRFNFFIKKKAQSSTLIIRGPSREILSEVERSLHDAECAMRLAFSTKKIVTGGGSVEMGLSRKIRDVSVGKIDNKKFIYAALGMSFEKIPMQLSENFGDNSIFNIQQLRMKHNDNHFFGLSILGPADMKMLGVYEPMQMKVGVIVGAFNIAELILSIDGTILKK